MASKKLKVKCTVNGKKVSFTAFPMQRMLDVLREDFKLTGSKEGCGEGECGACSVLVDGELVNSCLIPAIQMQGAKITTIEGIAAKKSLHAVQKHFLEWGATQCGICTPGMVLASTALLRKNIKPSKNEIKQALAGNLCRCTGYTKIFAALESLRK